MKDYPKGYWELSNERERSRIIAACLALKDWEHDPLMSRILIVKSESRVINSHISIAIHERGLELDPDIDLDRSMVATVDVLQWADFIKPPTTVGMLSIVQEFYANFADKDADDRVFVRGKRVPITREIIRDFYKLPDVHADLDCAYVPSMRQPEEGTQL
ncbi:uncharacterized protein G2W53_029536 [Senna tora]|uniref:Uncharacterized protein n=1 Tax=Senna tora TaxID=362788 RepID=A0A834T7T2_9FABA|nr:uncharacterized protein G2W53_029536 [Senna tora]